MFNDSIKELIGKIFRSELLDKEVNELIQYTVKLALYSFYNINQYDQFNAAAEKALTELYQLIIADVLSLKQLDHNYLAGLHFKRLRYWLVKYQPDASLLYTPDQPWVKARVVCSEYESATQMQVLNLSTSTLLDPILDIGCGKEHWLVDYLIQNGHAAFGIDRMQ